MWGGNISRRNIYHAKNEKKSEFYDLGPKWVVYNTPHEKYLQVNAQNYEQKGY